MTLEKHLIYPHGMTRIEKLRTNRNRRWTVAQLARAANVTVRTIENHEKLRGFRASQATQRNIASALGCAVSVIFREGLAR